MRISDIIEEFIKCVVVAFDSIYKDLISFDKTEMEISMDILLYELKEKINTVLERMANDGSIEDLVLKHSK